MYTQLAIRSIIPDMAMVSDADSDDRFKEIQQDLLSEGSKLLKGSFSNIILAMQEPQSNSVEKNNSCILDDEWFISMIKKNKLNNQHDSRQQTKN